MTLRTRLALASDIPALRSIAEEAYAPYVSLIGRRPIPMDADFETHIKAQEIYVAELGQQVVGFIVTYAKETSQFIENIAVSSKSQGSGVGKFLMAFADEKARSSGKPTMTLYTNDKMTESFDFYLRLGFIVTERKTEHGFDRIYLEKRLNP